MKIHIVQKGDTMWEIAQQYGVDFEELKQLNNQISSPDMIMPGMKVKIPGDSKSVKQQAHKKETQKPKEQPYKHMTSKPMPVIKEDDKEKPKMVKPSTPPMPSMPPMPVQPMMQMPMMEQEFQNYTTINFPPMPVQPKEEPKPVKKEKPKEEQKQVKPKKQSMPQPMPMLQPQVPMVPLCCYVMDPCYPQIPFQTMGPNPWACHGMAMQPMPYYHGNYGNMMGYDGAMPYMGYENMPHMQGSMMNDPNMAAWNGQMPSWSMQGMNRGEEADERTEQHTSAAPLYPPFQHNVNQMPFPMPPGYSTVPGMQQKNNDEPSE